MLLPNKQYSSHLNIFVELKWWNEHSFKRSNFGAFSFHTAVPASGRFARRGYTSRKTGTSLASLRGGVWGTRSHIKFDFHCSQNIEM